MNEIEKIEFIKSTQLFSSLSDKAREEIAIYFKPFQLSANEILFHQGDLPDYLYILVKGRLLAILELANKDLDVVGEIEEGEVLGELGIISKQPRTMTIKAATSSSLLKVTAADFFEKICEKYPSILADVIQPIISRSQKTLQILSKKKNKRHIAILSANKNVSMHKFKQNILNNLSKVAGMAFVENEASLSSSYQNQIDHLEKNNRTLLYFLDEHPELLKTSLAKVDTFYIINEEGLEIDLTSLDQIKKNNPWLQNVEEVLVILKHENISTPVSNILPERTFSFLHNIRIREDGDYQRLLRYMNGTPTGLVLGGGAFRGYIHLGVIRALQEAHIPIDMIGGTSAGSVAAGCFAFTEDAKIAAKLFHKVMSAARNPFALKNFTLPFVSLLSGKPGTEALSKIFGETKIENLYIPYFCMTANLNLKKETIHRTGYLWEKIRGSCSIPLLAPPIIIDGQMHVDGGLLNDLPVDIMRNYLGVDSKIIAVSIFAEKEDTRNYQFPPVLTLQQALYKLLKISNNDFEFPSFFDLYFRCMVLGASAKELHIGKTADIFISPDLSRYHFLSLQKGQEKELLNIGYQEMKKHL